MGDGFEIGIAINADVENDLWFLPSLGDVDLHPVTLPLSSSRESDFPSQNRRSTVPEGGGPINGKAHETLVGNQGRAEQSRLDRTCQLPLDLRRQGRRQQGNWALLAFT